MHRKSTKNKRRLAVVAAISAAGLASAGVYATTLGVAANQEAGGTDTVTTCDADGVVVSAGTPIYNSVTQQYEVTSITVSGLDATACLGQTLYVTAIKNDNSSLVDVTPWTIAGATTSVTHTFTGLTAFALENVKGYAVAIHEPLPT